MTSIDTAPPQAIEHRALDAFAPHPLNAKTHDLPMIVESIEHNGFFQVVGVQRSTGLTIFGHGRVDAARIVRAKIVSREQVGGRSADEWVAAFGTDLSWLPTVFYDVDDDTAARILAVDNAATIAGGIDPERLHALLAEIQGDGDPIERLRGTGYVSSDPARLLKEIAANRAAADPADPPAPFDGAGALRDEYGTALDQVWAIRGEQEHRLVICSNSDTRAPAALLDDGEYIDLIVTSPPYNVGVAYRSGGDDNDAGWPAYRSFLATCMAQWCALLPQGRVLAWNMSKSPKAHQHRQVCMFEDEFALTYYRELIWHKVGISLPSWYRTTKAMRARVFDPNYDYEVIDLLVKGERMEPGADLTEIDDLWSSLVMTFSQTNTRDIPAGNQRIGTGRTSGLDRRANKAHPAPFPVRLPSAMISMLADPGAIVCDPFMGAGSTMLAAEQRGRRAIGCELDPGYAAVALHRAQAIGMTVELLGTLDAAE